MDFSGRIEKAVLEDLKRSGVVVLHENGSLFLNVRKDCQQLVLDRAPLEMVLIAIIAISNLRALAGYEISDRLPKTELPRELADG